MHFILGLGSPYGKLIVSDFLVDMQHMVLSKDNVHICSSKSHGLNGDYLI